MSTAEVVNAIITASVGVGTISVAVLAIFGEDIRARLRGPRLRIDFKNVVPRPFDYPDGTVRLWWLAKVVNDRPSAIAPNCVVQLRKMWQRDAHGEFIEVPIPYPLPICWSPSEFTPPTRTIRHDETFDLGCLEQMGFAPNPRYFP